MDWGQFWTIVGVVLALGAIIVGGFLYLATQISGLRKELHDSSIKLVEEMHRESRDFHGRLVSLETRFASAKIKEAEG